MAGKVTDPALLAALDGAESPRRVEDPAVLAQLEGESGPSVANAIGTGLAQGATLGFGDELVGAASALAPGRDAQADTDLGAPVRPDGGYTVERDAMRAEDAAARAAHPVAHLGGELVGAGATAAAAPVGQFTGKLFSRLGKAAGVGAGYGAAAGAGYSEGETPGEVATDTAFGAAVGAPLGAAGEGAGSLVSWLRNKVAGKIGAAKTKAAGMAGTEKADEIASAAGELGGETQKGSRQIENLLRLESEKLLTPAQSLELQALRASGEVQAVAQGVAGRQLETLPGQASTIAAKRQALDALRQGAPEAIDARTQELLQSSFGPDLKSLFKQYGEPIVGTIGGGYVGELFDSPKTGAAVGGTLGLMAGRTRAGKAIAHRLGRPGNQRAIYEFLQRMLGGGAPVSPGTMQGARGAVTPEVADLARYLAERYRVGPSSVAAEDAP